MGLDFAFVITQNYMQHPDDMPYWSYSGFHRFRTKLAMAAGVAESYEDFDTLRHTIISIKYPNEPIIPLLTHSDCDGDLGPDDCAAIAPRLRELLATLDDTDYDKEHGLKLAAALEYAAENRCDLEFC